MPPSHRSDIIIPKRPLLQPPIRYRPSPRPPRLTTPQRFRVIARLYDSLLHQRLDLSMRRIRKEVFKIRILQRQRIARDAVT